jgi:NACHT domain
MPGRSVTLSDAGIQRAKQALIRKGLSQKALCSDTGYAWATINGFFNGKPIDRFIFQDLCCRLDLDWQTLLDIPPEQSPAATPLLKQLQQQATAYRDALTPRILERIPRAIASEKYIPAIDRSLIGDSLRVIAIIGPAGYGKSTLLGDLYDQLTTRNTPWVGLILCSTLTGPQTALDTSFGNSLLGTPTSLLQTTQTLTQTHGKGILLIDTLDLVINREFVIAFSQLLRQLLDQQVTVLFTCRDHEYNDFLEPTRERLPGLASQVDRHTIPNFSPSEIRQAATAFVQHLDPKHPERGPAFADNILSLSADSRSLQDILQNPLLLALLCDLFAQEGNVPADLTVSKLYQRYWTEKIAYSRADFSATSPIALAKNQFCLGMAQHLFEASQDKLCESIFQDELGIAITELNAKAFADLLSEGVLDRLPSRKIHFFHQTLLEYAIAYWLTRHQATALRTPWLAALKESDSSRYQSYWYPVLRQYLTLMDSEAEFTELATAIGPGNLAAFSAIAYGAVSRDRADALITLLPTALSLGEAYQKRLQQAIESAPKQIILATWPLLLDLLAESQHAVAINTAKMISLLIARWWQELKSLVPEAMDRVAARCQTIHSGNDDRSLIIGWLLPQWLPCLENDPDATILAKLREQYFLIGHRTSIKIIQLHQRSQIEAQIALFQIILQRELPNDKNLAENVLEFVTLLLMQSSKNTAIPSPIDFFEQSYPKRWENIQARAFGRIAVTHPDNLQILFRIILEDPEKEGDRFSRAYTAILEALNTGASSPVLQFFCNLDLPTLNPKASHAILRFLNQLAPQLPIEHQDAIAQWLQNFNLSKFSSAPHLLENLAETSLMARSTLKALLPDLSPTEQAYYQATQLRFLPMDEQPALSTLSKEIQIVFIRRYQRDRSPTATNRLLAASQCVIREVALLASQDWSIERITQLKNTQILPLLNSQFPGIQERALTWLLKRLDTITATDLTAICHHLRNPDNATIARHLCDLIATWIKANRQVPDRTLPTIDRILTSLIHQGNLDGAPAKPMIQALKAIAQSEDPTIDLQQLYNCTSKLLTNINLISIPHSESEMIDVLSAIVRIMPTALGMLVSEIGPLLTQKNLWRNLSAMIYTIARIEGKASSYFDAIGQSDWYCREVEGIILEVRGV